MNQWKIAAIAYVCLGTTLSFGAALDAPDASAPLFTIGHTGSANVVQYEAKLKNGKLDPQQPIAAYWIMAGEDGRRQELNFLERLKAYGFTFRSDSTPESYVLTIISDKKKEIRIFRMGNTIRAVAKIGTCDAYLQRIFIATKKGFLLSMPEYAEMIGNDVSTGAECRERVAPSDR
jgi:hypothetical protein